MVQHDRDEDQQVLHPLVDPQRLHQGAAAAPRSSGGRGRGQDSFGSAMGSGTRHRPEPEGADRSRQRGRVPEVAESAAPVVDA